MGRGRGETQLTDLCGSRVLASLGLRGWAGSLGRPQPWRALSRPHPSPHALSPAPSLGPCGAGVDVSPAQLWGTSVNLDELSGPSLCPWATSPVKTRFTLHSLGPREHHPQRSDCDGGLGSFCTSTTLNNRLDSVTPALTLLSAHWPLPLMLGHFCLWRRNAILDRAPPPQGLILKVHRALLS